MTQSKRIHTVWVAWAAVWCFNGVAPADIWYEQAKLLPDDGAAGDLFGLNVSISGDTAIIGAYGDDDGSGSAYIFQQTGSTWSQVAKLLPNDRRARKRFGSRVSISGNTAIVADWPEALPFRSAYIFQDSGSGWRQVAKLWPSDGAERNGFGGNVSISGNTAIVGAYVFADTGSGWTQVAKLLPSDGTEKDGFGGSVSLSGNTAIIGASGNDAAYVFQGTGSCWTQVAKLSSSDGAEGGSFGSQVSISGSTVIVASVGSGSAYIFQQIGSTWSQVAKLLPNDGAELDNFGSGLSLSGNTAIVGAWGSCSASVFQDTGSDWTQVAKLLPSDGAGGYGFEGDGFGENPSISGNTAIVGAHRKNDYSGAAYIFTMDEPGSLTWGGLGDGNWDSPTQWLGGQPGDVPDDTTAATVRNNTVTVDGGRSARSVTVESGTLRLGPTGSLQLGQNFTLQAGSQVTCQLDGPANGRVTTAADASLDGTLRVQALGKLQPQGQPWGHAAATLITAASISGTFAQEPATGDHLGHGVFHDDVSYTDTTVDIDIFQAAAGDVDGNREINNADLQHILAADSFNNPGPRDWTQGDFNGDGLVGNTDLQLILATGYFGTGPYAASAPGPIAVPEPTTLVMFLTATLGLLLVRRRRLCFSISRP